MGRMRVGIKRGDVIWRFLKSRWQRGRLICLSLMTLASNRSSTPPHFATVDAKRILMKLCR